jgi:hypothetical protein
VLKLPVIPIKKLAAIEKASLKLTGLLATVSPAPNRFCVWSPDISTLLKLIREPALCGLGLGKRPCHHGGPGNCAVPTAAATRKAPRDSSSLNRR